MFLTGIFKVMAHGDDLKAPLALLHYWLCMDSCVSAHNTLMKTVECAYIHAAVLYVLQRALFRAIALKVNCAGTLRTI